MRDRGYFARQVLSHSFAMMANLTSIMHTGVPARYPKLRVVFIEADIAWVPCMAWRIDKYYMQYGTPLQLAKILSRFFGTFLSRVLSFYIDKELPLRRERSTS